MKTISKLHDKCNECKYKDECNEKRMVACGMMELPPKARADIKAPVLEPMAAKMAKEYTPITIYRGENCTIDTNLEEIKRQIEEDFYKQAKCGLMR